MYGVSLAWETCPGGVELIDFGEDRPSKQGVWVRYRSEQREPINHSLSDLENPIVLHFINAREDDALLEFLARFGMLYSKYAGKTPMPECPWDSIKDSRIKFSDILHSIHKTFSDEAKYTFTSDLELTLSFEIRGHKRTKPTLKAQSLFDFMAMEIASIAQNGAKPAMCQHCRTVFITGPLTGRRSHAMFCADRCRVAAMRKRKAEAGKGAAT